MQVHTSQQRNRTHFLRFGALNHYWISIRCKMHAELKDPIEQRLHRLQQDLSSNAIRLQTIAIDKVRNSVEIQSVAIKTSSVNQILNGIR